MRAVAPRFIACPSDLDRARIVVYGIPFEGRVNLRKGACDGPRDLRLASDSVETYSPAPGGDLEDLPPGGIGGWGLPDGARPGEQLDAARVGLAAGGGAVGRPAVAEVRERQILQVSPERG